MPITWEKGFPVDFRSGGDTTRVAFGKHIQEIERIYGYLNLLNSSKVEAGDIDTAITNAINNLKNTWKPTNLTFNDINGDLAASRVVGDLTNATIDKGNVTGLEALINSEISAIPKPVDKGDGIISVSKSRSGYVRFNNGIMFQWGRANTSNTEPTSVNFPYSFNSIFTVITTAVTENYDGSGMAHHSAAKANSAILQSYSTGGFVLWQTKGYDVCYFAVGLS